MTQTPFLSRWSRLKTEKPPVVVVQEPVEDITEKLKTLPSIEDMVAGSDISQFMQNWVPDALKNAVMRKMWSVDAALTEHLCQPLDYHYDYNNPVGVVGFGAVPEGYDPLAEIEKLFEKIEKPVLELKPEIIEEPEPTPIELEVAEVTPQYIEPNRKHGGALPQ